MASPPASYYTTSNPRLPGRFVLKLGDRPIAWGDSPNNLIF
jgi:hypothetical protein